MVTAWTGRRSPRWLVCCRRRRFPALIGYGMFAWRNVVAPGTAVRKRLAIKQCGAGKNCPWLCSLLHRKRGDQPPADLPVLFDPLVGYRGTSSTRRFLVRPSSVLLTATGARLATPLAVNRPALMPCSLVRAATTASALRLERVRLAS
jgi:hypothetical protein